MSNLLTCACGPCVSKQGLLRVAIENARAQEKQDQLERTELKMELVRERELRETLERQLSVEQKNRGAYGGDECSGTWGARVGAGGTQVNLLQNRGLMSELAQRLDVVIVGKSFFFSILFLVETSTYYI